MAETSGRRQAAMKETREALIAAALAEFAEHGLDQPSLDAICSRAGYTRGAFYVHFKDRNDLIVAVVEHALGTFIDGMLGSGEGPRDVDRTVARFAEAVEAAHDTVAAPSALALPLPASVPLARLLEALTRNARLRERFASLLDGAVERLGEAMTAGQQAGNVRADVAPRAAAFLLVMIALGTVVAVDLGLPIDVSSAKTAALQLLNAER